MDQNLYLEAAEQRFTEFGGFQPVTEASLAPLLAEWAAFTLERTEPGLITMVACVPLEAGSLLPAVRDELAAQLAGLAKAGRTEGLGLLLLFSEQPINRSHYDRVQGLVLQSGKVRVVPWIVDLGRGRLFGHEGPPFGIDPDLAMLAAPTHEPVVQPTAQPSPGRTGPLPWMTVGLMAIILLIWLAMTLAGGSLTATEDPQLLRDWGAALRPKLIIDREYWRLWTSGFLHIGIAHLAMNSLSLWWVGQAVEALYGPVRMLLIYSIALVAGSAASLLFGPALIQVAGASGAIFGLLGALLWYRVAGEERYRLQQVPLLMIVLVNLGYGLISYRTVDNWGHLGGLVGGFIAAAAVGTPWQGRPPVARILRQGVATLALLGVTGVTLLGLVPLPGPSQRLASALDALENGRLEEAQTGVERAVKAQPDQPSLRLTLAWIYYAEGRLAESQVQLNQVLAVYPEDEDALDLQRRIGAASAPRQGP